MDKTAKRELYCEADLAEATSRWIKDLESQNLSKHTRRAYETDLEDFLRFIAHYEGEASSINSLSKLDMKAARAWITDKAKKGIAIPSRKRSVSSIRNFFRFLDDSGTMHNPVFNIIMTPKNPKRLPKPIEQTSLDELLSRAKTQTDDWTASRNYALFSLLYGCGLRIDEALSLTIKDIERSKAEEHMLRIMGKGGKERLVPLIKAARLRIRLYLCHAGKEGIIATSDERHLFIGVKGQKLNQGMAQKAMRNLRTDLGLPDHVTPHALRHSYATHLLSESYKINKKEEQLNLREIQELLGHASLVSTQLYTEIENHEILDIYKKYHPRNKKEN